MKTFNLNVLTFEFICKEIENDHFYMHYDYTDTVRFINSPACFEDVKKSIIDTYGNVKVKVSYRMEIEDDKWKKDHREFCDRKQAWCDKYGCD